MNYNYVFMQAFIYLLAAVITVPIAKKVGLGTVLGYILAGIIIGPYVLGLIGHTDNVMHFAEFGVVMMLFLIGLELQPTTLWQLRKQIFLIGGLQVIFTALLVTFISKLFGLDWVKAFTIGIIATSSSTAIVLQLLAEKKWIKLDAGNTIFAILLFQDVAVIPILAIFPLLSKHMNNLGANGVEGWKKALLIILLISIVIIAGKYLFRPIFRFIASSKLHEAFTALALLLVIGIALSMQYVGLSPALGAFLAGLVLAESEYRHELEADIQPFKGLLLGLFFISIGGNINFPLILANLPVVLVMLAILISVKFMVLFIIGKIYKQSLRDNLMISMTLAQGGEFCFVLLAYALKEQILPELLVRELIAVVALSMLLTPLIILFYQKILEPRFKIGFSKSDFDVVGQENPVLIAGFGRFGQIIGRFMLANGIGTTVLDIDANQVDSVRKFGFKVYYGDARRLEILNLAGLMHAKVLVLALDDTEAALKISTLVKQSYPKLRILLRVRSRTQVYEALRLGINLSHVYRETFDSALHVGVDVLTTLGIDQNHAVCSSLKFKQIDEKQLKNMYTIYDGDNVGEDYISQARQHTKDLENILNSDVNVTKK